MRIPAAILTLALLSGTPVLAQGISFGAKGGANFAAVSFDNAPDATAGRWSVAAGAFAILPLRWHVSFQPEVLYTRKGAQLRGAGVRSSLLLDYVEVPALARFGVHAFGTRLFVVGGPAAGFRVRARTRTEFSAATEEIDVSDGVERFDLGVAGGAGVELGALLLEGRYTFGLTDIDTDREDDARARNRVWSILAGWRF
jgi:hypothetical protein